MKPEDRRRLKQHIEMIVEHKMPTHNVTFCPNCECDRETILYSEVLECTVCHETFEVVCGINPSNSDVSMTQDVLTDVKTGQSVEIEELETVVEHLQIRLSEWRGVAMLLVDELNEAKSKQLPTSWEDASVASPAYIAYRNLVDVEDYEDNPDYYKGV